MIVQNQTGGGGPKIPEGTFVIVDYYVNCSSSKASYYDHDSYPSKTTLSTTWTVPLSGKYRVTVIGAGGAGRAGSAGKSGGGGGGSGGWCCSILELTAGEEVPITINTSVSSFGSYLSATAGTSGSGDRVNPGSGGVASGGNIFNFNGEEGYEGDSDNGGSGASVSNRDKSPFISNAQGGYYGRSQSLDNSAYQMIGKNGPPTGLFIPLGSGGGGGARWLSSRDGDGAQGGYGAVIIELLLEGVNT